MFNPAGTMTAASGTATLKKNLAEEGSVMAWGSPTVMVVDVSAVLGTIDWPAKAQVTTFVQNMKDWLESELQGSDVYMTFDRYKDFSTKSCTKIAPSKKDKSSQNHPEFPTATPRSCTEVHPQQDTVESPVTCYVKRF